MSVFVEQCQQLNNCLNQLRSVSREINDIHEKAKNTWFINPNGLELRKHFNRLKDKLSAIRNDYDYVREETKALSQNFKPSQSEIETITEMSIRIIHLGSSISSKADEVYIEIGDNLFVIIEDVFNDFKELAKGFVKITIQGAKAVLEGARDIAPILLPGW